jgi:hypothetical protein
LLRQAPSLCLCTVNAISLPSESCWWYNCSSLWPVAIFTVTVLNKIFLIQHSRKFILVLSNLVNPQGFVCNNFRQCSDRVNYTFCI